MATHRRLASVVYLGRDPCLEEPQATSAMGRKPRWRVSIRSLR